MQTTLRNLTVAWPLVIFLLLPALTRAETAVQAWVEGYSVAGNTDAYATAMAVDGSNNVIVTGYSGRIPSSSDYATIKYSSVGVPLWTNSYNGPANSLDYAWAVAVDGSNNVIVTGYSSSSYSTLSMDYATIKYSSAGVLLWTKCYNGPGNGDDEAFAVAVDSSNSVIVTGFSTNGNSGYDYATIKYSSAGSPVWTNRYNGPANGDDKAWAVAVDGSNNVIVTGQAVGSGSSYDYATIEYSSAGVPLWTNLYNGPGNGDDKACALAVDSNRDVIVTGSSSNGADTDYATIKYSSAGVPLWTNRYNGPGNGGDKAYAVVVDGSNNVIVTGSSLGNGSSYGYATIKYSSAGVPLWTNRYDGPGIGNDYDFIDAVAVDGSNNVIMTGWSTNSASGRDYLIVKYSSAGVPLWTNCYSGPGNHSDKAKAVAVDRSGNVIVAGYSTGSSGYYGFATIKYICVPEPVMTALPLTNGTFQMRVDDMLQPGTLVIEACTNLEGWAPVFTNTTPTNVLFYTDPDAGNSPMRFYRAFQFP